MILGEGFANIRVGMVLEFTSKYRIRYLVYYESTNDVRVAIEREADQGWLRAKKIALIESMNPAWRDLSADWFG